MHLHELEKSGYIIFESVVGSHLYNLNIGTSDVDKMGLFRLPKSSFISLQSPSQEVEANKGDHKLFELKKFMTLAAQCNPTICQLLYIPEKFILKTSDIYNELIRNKGLFVSKKAYYTYTGYAYAQIKKARGQNKKVNKMDELTNPEGVRILREALKSGDITQDWLATRFCGNFLKFIARDYVVPEITTGEMVDYPESDKLLELKEIKCMMKPVRDDFIYFVKDGFGLSGDERFINALMPFRPQKMMNRKGYDVSAVEHMTGLYRLYNNGTGIKFTNNDVICTSISKERETSDFAGIMYFNTDGYEAACKEWESFWEWMANKNDARWVSQERGEIDYDCKNLMHTMRLLIQSEYILNTGEPKIFFEGEERDYLMNIRLGKMQYEEILNVAEQKCVELKDKFDKSLLPHSVDNKKIDALYVFLMEM